MLCPWPKWTAGLSLVAGYFNLLACVMLDSTLAQAVVSNLTACLDLMVVKQVPVTSNVQVSITVAVLLLWALKNKLSLVNQGILEVTCAVF